MELSKKERMKLKSTVTRKKKTKKGENVVKEVPHKHVEQQVSAQAFPRQHREESPIPEQFNL